MRKTKLGLFLSALILAGCAVVLPRTAEARRLGEEAPSPQSRLVKIPKVRRTHHALKKAQPATRHWVIVHSPSCTEIPPLSESVNWARPLLEDDDDDVLVPEMAAVDTDRRALVREVRSVVFEYASERIGSPVPPRLERPDGAQAARMRVRLLPKLPDSGDASDSSSRSAS